MMPAPLDVCDMVRIKAHPRFAGRTGTVVAMLSSTMVHVAVPGVRLYPGRPTVIVTTLANLDRITPQEAAA